MSVLIVIYIRNFIFDFVWYAEQRLCINYLTYLLSSLAETDILPEMKRSWSVCNGGKMELLPIPAAKE